MVLTFLIFKKIWKDLGIVWECGAYKFRTCCYADGDAVGEGLDPKSPTPPRLAPPTSCCWPPESPHPCCCSCCCCSQQLLHFGSQRQEVSLLPPAFWSPVSVSRWQNLTGNQLARSPGNIIFRIPAPSAEWSIEGQVRGWEVIGKWSVHLAGSK